MQNIAAATSITATPLAAPNFIYKYNALFGRLNYNWEDKYLIDITANRDGSSRFGPDNRFANFYALGAGWIFSKENFVQKELPFLSFGKLRGSYGTTGSDQVGNYSYLDLYNNIPNIGVPYQGANGIYPTQIYTPNLAWELTTKSEAGLELGFFKDRITLNISFYLNHSSNELVNYSLPSITGFIDVEKNLPAVVQNKGWEFELNTINIVSKNFRWTSSFNLTINSNILASGSPGLASYLEQKVGDPIESQYVYRFLGVNPITGIYQFADSHGNPTYNPNPATDLTYLISDAQRFYGGFQNSVSYRNFQLDFLFQFVNRPEAPIYKFNYIAGFFGGYDGSNQPVTILSRWQQPGDVSNVERFSTNFSLLNSYSDATSSNLAYGDGSYIRLKNLSLSWALPEEWIKKISLKNLRIYLQGQNLLTITKYQGLDPEYPASNLTLPPLKVWTLGVQATL